MIKFSVLCEDEEDPARTVVSTIEAKNEVEAWEVAKERFGSALIDIVFTDAE